MTAATTSIPGEGAPSAVATGKLRVLYAEDHDITRNALGYILGQAAFEVTAVADGMQAVDQLKRNRFDVMLLDLRMPGLDGYKVLEAMHRLPAERAVPVVVLSEFADRESVSKCVALRVKRFLVKRSLMVDRLCQALRECVQKPQAPATGAAGEKADAAAVQATPADPVAEAEVMLDQQKWKERLVDLGRVAREQAVPLVQTTVLPVLFPSILDELRTAVSADGNALDDMVSEIEQDPRLLVEVLGLANKSQETNVAAPSAEVAMRWIGKAGIRTIVTALEASASKQPPEAQMPWIVRWWMHSVAVAQIAGRLAPLLELQPAQAMVAGMLHDLARLVLLCSELGPKAATCYDLSRNMAITTTFAEQSLLGVSHAQAARLFGDRAGLPESILEVCETHEFDDTRRQAMEQGKARMSALICAADQLAKIAGFGSLANDELLPMPEMVASRCDRVVPESEAALAEIQTILTWRLAGRQPAPVAELVRLDGLVVGMVSTRATPLNSYQRLLSRAGARCMVYQDASELLSSQHTLDLLMMDQSRDGISPILPVLRRISQHAMLSSTPRLLLARRSDDPEQVLGQAGLSAQVYATPIRAASLLQVVRRLTRG